MPRWTVTRSVGDALEVTADKIEDRDGTHEQFVDFVRSSTSGRTTESIVVLRLRASDLLRVELIE